MNDTDCKIISHLCNMIICKKITNLHIVMTSIPLKLLPNMSYIQTNKFLNKLINNNLCNYVEYLINWTYDIFINIF